MPPRNWWQLPSFHVALVERPAVFPGKSVTVTNFAIDILGGMHDHAHLLGNEMPTDIEQRDRRRQAIVDLERRSRIASQEELRAKLAARGFEATQPLVSRDFGIRGGQGGRARRRRRRAGPETRDALDEAVHFVRGVRPAGWIAGISTTVGPAQTVAIAPTTWASGVRGYRRRRRHDLRRRGLGGGAARFLERLRHLLSEVPGAVGRRSA